MLDIEVITKGIVLGLVFAVPFVVAEMAMRQTIKKAEEEYEDWRKNVKWGTSSTKADYYRRHGKRH